MNKKVSKSLFLISQNARITTQELSKKTRSSQQSASYLVNQLEKKKIIQNYNTIIDPAKLGFTNIFVGLNFLVLDYKEKRSIISELKKIIQIISIQEGNYGVDLMLEYSVNNLSAFNKIHTDIALQYHKSLETKLILPVVVKHKFPKSYLINRSNDSDMILCGDRETKQLSEKELEFLKELIANPKINFTKLSQKLKIAAKTVVNIKKRLEKQKIIRGYDCTLNYKKLGVNRRITLVKLSGAAIGEMDKLIAHCLNHKNVVEAVKIIGNHQLMIITEAFETINILNELRSLVAITDYRIIDIDNISKEYYLPDNI